MTGYSDKKQSIVLRGHLQLEALDHLIVFSVERDQSQVLLDCSRGDQRTEHMEPVRFRIRLEKLVLRAESTKIV